MNKKDANMLFKMGIKKFVKTYSPVWLIGYLIRAMYLIRRLNCAIKTMFGRWFKNHIQLKKNSVKSKRYLEIGPGSKKIPGFEALNIVGGPNVDYVFDASKKLPFKDNTFEVIYASHSLEHIPWYKTENVLKEWVRILKPRGKLEVWVPNGLKICETLLKAEIEGVNSIYKDGWYKFNLRKNPCVWASGRLFTYGDGTGNINQQNWHRAIFTPRYLKELFELVGLVNIKEMNHSEVRGYDHGWINLGVKGTKP